jgi:hypothetical protein
LFSGVELYVPELEDDSRRKAVGNAVAAVIFPPHSRSASIVETVRAPRG